MASANNIPPFVENVPLGRELGILFGFLLVSLVIMGIYAVLWRSAERRDEERDKLRREQLVARGVHHGRGGLHEKILDQEAFMARAELPVLEITRSPSPTEVMGSRLQRERERERVGEMSRPVLSF